MADALRRTRRRRRWSSGDGLGRHARRAARPRRDRHRPGRHRDALRAAARRAGRRPGALRRRRLRPRAADGDAARRAAPGRGAGRRRRKRPAAVHRARPPGRAGGDVHIDASGSSQFVSGLLLAARPLRQGHRGSARRRAGAVPAAHRDDRADAARGRRRGGRRAARRGGRCAPGPIRAGDHDVEPDLSNAAPFLAAAIGHRRPGHRARLAGAHHPGRRRAARVARPDGRARSELDARRPHGRPALGRSGRWTPTCTMSASSPRRWPRSRALADGAVAAAGHRPPARARDRPAGRAGHRAPALGGDVSRRPRRPGDPPAAAARRDRGTPTPITGWPPPARCWAWWSPGIVVDDIDRDDQDAAGLPRHVVRDAGRGAASRRPRDVTGSTRTTCGSRPGRARYPAPLQAAPGARRRRRRRWWSRSTAAGTPCSSATSR